MMAHYRPVGTGVGGSLKSPHLTSKGFYTLPSYTFMPYIVSKPSTSLDAIESHHRPNKFGCATRLLLRTSGWIQWVSAQKEAETEQPGPFVSLPAVLFFCKSLMSAGLVSVIHGYNTGENWMQYSADHIATTALLLFQNGPRTNLRASI